MSATAVVGAGAARIAAGVVAVSAPNFLLGLLEDEHGSSPVGIALTRALGVREMVIGAAQLFTLRSGSTRRSALLVGAAVDIADLGSLTRMAVDDARRRNLVALRVGIGLAVGAQLSGAMASERLGSS